MLYNKYIMAVDKAGVCSAKLNTASLIQMYYFFIQKYFIDCRNEMKRSVCKGVEARSILRHIKNSRSLGLLVFP